MPDIPKLEKSWRELAARLAVELGIIVIGVTIALWADSRVQEHADRSREEARLEALGEQIAETTERLKDELEGARGAADAIRRLIDAGNSSEADRINDLRFAIQYGSTFAPEISVYADLENAGELALLTDADVRRSLAELDTELQVLQLAQDDLATVQQLHIDAFVIDHADIQSLFAPGVGLASAPLREQQAAELLGDLRFRNRMLLKLDLVTQLMERFQLALEALQEAASHIEARLES